MFSPSVEKIPWRRACNPLQYSCLGISMDGGAWQTAVHGVTKSQTGLRTTMYITYWSVAAWGCFSFCSLLTVPPWASSITVLELLALNLGYPTHKLGCRGLYFFSFSAVSLLCNITLVSPVQESDSAICIHMPSLLDLPPPSPSHPSRSSQSTELSFPLTFSFTHSSSCMSVLLPVRLTLTLPFPCPRSTCSLYTSASLFLHSEWVRLYISHIYRFHIYVFNMRFFWDADILNRIVIPKKKDSLRKDLILEAAPQNISNISRKPKELFKCLSQILRKSSLKPFPPPKNNI